MKLEFDIEYDQTLDGAMRLDAAKFPSVSWDAMTFVTGVGDTHDVRLLDYATVVSGSETAATVFIDISGDENMDGGIDWLHLYFRDTRFTVTSTDCRVETQLTATVNAGDASLPVQSTAGFSAADGIWIERAGTNEEQTTVAGVLSNSLTASVSMDHPNGSFVTRKTKAWHVAQKLADIINTAGASVAGRFGPDQSGVIQAQISFEQLARDKQLGGDTIHIQRPLKEYELIVIDEAQAFRNPDTTRGRALMALLQDDPPKKLVLMSATPVNNSIWDLYYLLGYFIKHDAAFSGVGIRSLKDKFRQVADQDPDALRPEALFDVLDATMVRRTRSFVQKYYPNDKVTGLAGLEIPIRFPQPHVQRTEYSLDDVLPGFFGEFADALMPEEGEPILSMARYRPGSFREQPDGDASEAALVGLVRSGLLKRFESSVHAFSRTLERLIGTHDVFLDGLDRGVVLTAEEIEEWQQLDSDGAIEELLAVSGSESCNGYRAKELREYVASDRTLLSRLHEQARRVTQRDDPKLRALVNDAIKPLLAFSDRSRLWLSREDSEVSRFSCMLFLSVRGFSDYAGPACHCKSGDLPLSTGTRKRPHVNLVSAGLIQPIPSSPPIASHPLCSTCPAYTVNTQAKTNEASLRA